jgi:hypothetical protein
LVLSTVFQLNFPVFSCVDGTTIILPEMLPVLEVLFSSTVLGFSDSPDSNSRQPAGIIQEKFVHKENFIKEIYVSRLMTND